VFFYFVQYVDIQYSEAEVVTYLSITNGYAYQ